MTCNEVMPMKTTRWTGSAKRRVEKEHEYIRMNNNVAAVLMNDQDCSVVTDPAVMTFNQWLDIFQYHAQRQTPVIPIKLAIHDPHDGCSPLHTLVYTLRTMLLSKKSIAIHITLDNRTSMSDYTWREMMRNQYLPDLAFYITYNNFKSLWNLESSDRTSVMRQTYLDATALAKSQFEQMKADFDAMVALSCKKNQS